MRWQQLFQHNPQSRGVPQQEPPTAPAAQLSPPQQNHFRPRSPVNSPSSVGRLANNQPEKPTIAVTIISNPDLYPSTTLVSPDRSRFGNTPVSKDSPNTARGAYRYPLSPQSPHIIPSGPNSNAPTIPGSARKPSPGLSDASGRISPQRGSELPLSPPTTPGSVPTRPLVSRRSYESLPVDNRSDDEIESDTKALLAELARRKRNSRRDNNGPPSGISTPDRRAANVSPSSYRSKYDLRHSGSMPKLKTARSDVGPRSNLMEHRANARRGDPRDPPK